MNVKMIAAWGSSGAGKSTVAAALAAKLAKKQKNVVVISTDSKSPALPIFLPNVSLTTKNSLGGVLSSDNITYANLKDKFHIHPKSERIGFAGLVTGENAITYKAFERDNVLDFLKVLSSSPFEYVIFDCESNPVYDSMTLLALEASNVVLRIITPDVKGYEFQKSQLLWLSNGENFNTHNHIKIACPVYETSPIKEADTLAGGFDFCLPFSYEIMGKFTAGELLENFKDTNAQLFESEIDKLCERIIDENEN